jgi:hypothetical protein
MNILQPFVQEARLHVTAKYGFAWRGPGNILDQLSGLLPPHPLYACLHVNRITLFLQCVIHKPRSVSGSAATGTRLNRKEGRTHPRGSFSPGGGPLCQAPSMVAKAAFASVNVSSDADTAASMSIHHLVAPRQLRLTLGEGNFSLYDT